MYFPVGGSPLAIVFCALVMILLFIPATSFGQSAMNSPLSDVSGRYVSPDGEVEVTLPAGWNAMEVTSPSETIVATAPSEFTIDTINELDVAMFLITSEKGLVDRAPDTIPPFSKGEVHCLIQSDAAIIMSNVVAKASTFTCALDEKQVIVMSVLVQTLDRWVAVMYVADIRIQESYNSLFNEMVRTVSVNDAIDMDIDFNVHHKIETLYANGTQVLVMVRSSSNLTDLAFDEEKIALSFNVDGPVGSRGVTDISIGKILEGPYSVMIDDTIINDFDLVEGATREDNRIIVTYRHDDSKKISISGARVVPEFPVHSLVLSAMSIILLMAILRKYAEQRITWRLP
jgi:hypothetical protein